MNRHMAIVLCMGILQGCAPGPESARGFRLPDGNARAGLEAASLNETMTVQQLVDIVTYLQPLYEVRPPEYDPYSYIYR